MNESDNLKSMKKILFASLVLCFLLQNCVFCEEFCYTTNGQYLHTRQFSTKTSYPRTIDPIENQLEKYKLPNCKSDKIWLLVRHGTRLATDKEIIQMQKLPEIRDEIVYNYEKIQIKNQLLNEATCAWRAHNKTIRNTQKTDIKETDVCRKTSGTRNSNNEMCLEDISLLKNWTMNPEITINKASFLSTQGWNDINGLAMRFKELLPHLFNRNYSSHFRFLHSRTQRNEESYKAFLRGLFGKKVFKKISHPIIPEIETFLKPYEYCNVTKINSNEIEDGQDSELWRFKISPIFTKMIEEVSSRLSLPRQLSIQEISLLWDICRYDQAWNTTNQSPWCSVFTPTHLDILEYSEDLRYYYKSCHGYQLNRRLPCELIQDMLQHTATTNHQGASNKEDPKVVVYFAHSTMLHLMLAAFDAVKDSTTLRWNNFIEMTERKFHSSRHAPFGANLALIHYECSNDVVGEKEKIGIFLNERPFSLDWCNDNVCDLSIFKQKFESFSNCKETFCGAISVL